MKIRKLLPLIGLIIFLIVLSTLNLTKISEIFSSITPFYAFLCFFAPVPLILLANVEWQILLKKQKINVSFWYSIKNFFIGYFYGFITPGGFGAYTRSLYLSDESGAPLPKCFSNIVIFNTVEFLAMLTAGAIGAVFLSRYFPYLLYTIILVFFVVIFLFVFFFKKERSKIIFIKIVQTRIFSSIKDRLEDSIDSFYEDIPRFKDILLPFILSITGWFLKYVIMFFTAKLFFVNILFIDFILIMAVADVISSIPVSIYGLGTREVVLIGIFGVFGVTAENIVSLSLFWYVIFYLVPTILGFFVTFFESRGSYEFKLDQTMAISFEKYMKRFPELYEYLADIVKNNIAKDVKNPVIVDLGVGPGLLSKEINSLIPDATIIGIDPSEKMLKLAEKNATIKTKVGIAEKIPIEDKSVDVVVSRFNLSYWKDAKKGFCEINRILKPGGKFVIEALNKDFSGLKLFFIRMSMVFKGSGFDIARYHVDAYKTAYSSNSVKKLFRDSGFEIIYSEGEKKDWKFIFVGKKCYTQNF